MMKTCLICSAVVMADLPSCPECGECSFNHGAEPAMTTSPAESKPLPERAPPAKRTSR